MLGEILQMILLRQSLPLSFCCSDQIVLFYTGRLNFLPCRTLQVVCVLAIDLRGKCRNNVKERVRCHTCCMPGQDVLGVIDPEKVRIQDGLDGAGDPGDWIHITLGEVSIQPIGDV